MAHNLEIKKDGKASFVSTQKAWHGLGEIVEGALTSKDAIEKARLDYTVDIRPAVLSLDGYDKGIVVPDKFITYRNDTNMPLGIVGNRYKIVQNVDAFEFFDEIVGSKDCAMFETAGVLGSGERIFITAKMPDVIQIAGTDDITEVYVLLTSSHDGSGSIIAAITPVRVVCQNTLNAALGSTINRVAIRHTTNAQSKLKEAHKLLGISHIYVNEVNEMFNALAKKTITDAQVRSLVEQVFASGKKEEVEGTEDKKKESTRIINIRNEVMTSYFEGVGQDKILGTAWGAYNGITHYLSHIKNYKTGDVKLDSLMAGESTKIANEAFKQLIKL